jgi:hypothetical protein
MAYYGPLGGGLPAATPPADASAAARELYLRWFAAADADNDGRLTGGDAVRFFERSGLPRDQLAKVWAFADSARRGYLDVAAFTRALELVSLAQASGQVSLEALNAARQGGAPIAPPAMAGLAGLAPPAAAPPPPPPPASPPGGGLSPRTASGNPFGDAPAELPSPPTPADAAPGSVPPSNVYSHAGAAPAQSPLTTPTAAAAAAAAAGGSPRPGGPSAFGAGAGLAPGKLPSAAKRRGPLTTKDVTSIADGLRRIYFQKVRGG